MPSLALTAAPFEPAQLNYERRPRIKTLESIVAILSWIVLAIVLYALSPLIIQLVKVADHLNHLFGK